MNQENIENLSNEEVTNLLKLKEEHIGLHALNPWIMHTSSSRGTMSSSHLSQTIPIKGGDARLIQTGMDRELGKFLFDIKVEEESRVINVIKKYNGMGGNIADEDVGYFLILLNLKTSEIYSIDIPQNNTMHVNFGFKYIIDEKYIRSLMKGNVIKAGTILAKPPTLGENFEYKFGRNLDAALVSLPEVSEDGFLVCDEVLDYFRFDFYEKVSISYGLNEFPLNVYGDKQNYKAHPNIGETIKDDGTIMALRSYDSGYGFNYMSVRDTMQWDENFDKVYFAKKGGSKVVDMEAVHTPKGKHQTFKGVTWSTERILNGMEKYYRDILDTYLTLREDNLKKFKKDTLVVSEEFTTKIQEAMIYLSKGNKQLTLLHRKDPLDLYKVDFTLEKELRPNIQYKLSNLHG
jgi:hypothetical protein